MSKNKGFSLVELISSILIFSVAMTGIVLFSAHNSKSVVRSEKEAQLSVQSERAFEQLKAWLIEAQDPLQPNRLMFDSIWETYSQGDTIYQRIDTIDERITQCIVVIDSFQYTQDDPTATYSRLWCRIITMGISESNAVSTWIVISRHR